MNIPFKTIHDPIYGFIELPKGIILDLLEHPFYQRLRRISQLGTVQYVYLGAVHSRFNHTIGALHLMQQAISTLRRKGIAISDEEAEAVSIAILLHDVGHCPFSHSLEYQLMNVHHEELSVLLMEQLNAAMGGRLSMALSIFRNEYPKPFLYQLVSSQLDMDRLDYLTRDSYFTGVYEGKVGYERILKMLNVHNDELVIELKGIYSVEKFLIARRLMYWQVYLHKAVACASRMLSNVIKRARFLAMQQGETFAQLPPALNFFLQRQITTEHLQNERTAILQQFVQLDDSDIWYALKVFAQHNDKVLAYLSKGLLERRLLKTEQHAAPVSDDILQTKRQAVMQEFGISEADSAYLVFAGKEANRAYDANKQEIYILLNDGTTQPISAWSEHNIQPREVVKHYICYPKHNF